MVQQVKAGRGSNTSPFVHIAQKKILERSPPDQASVFLFYRGLRAIFVQFAQSRLAGANSQNDTHGCVDNLFHKK